ncbi:hypothetical protein N7504_011452 [Penicillium tannophilum]|nr:hypothetical protein N7504_011452 [Penicillium tannophilum]
MILPTINAGAPPDFGVMFSLHSDPEPLLPAHHFKSSKLLIAACKKLPVISLVEAAPQKITTSPEPPSTFHVSSGMTSGDLGSFTPYKPRT